MTAGDRPGARAPRGVGGRRGHGFSSLGDVVGGLAGPQRAEYARRPAESDDARALARIDEALPRAGSGSLAERVAAATHTCERCGVVVEPLVTRQGMVIRRRCKCEWERHREDLAEQQRRYRELRRPEVFFHSPRSNSLYDQYADLRLETWDPQSGAELRDLAGAYAGKVVELWEGAEPPDGDASLLDVARKHALRQVPNLAVLGPFGVGKTRACAGIAHKLHDRDVGVLFARAIDVLEAIKDSWDRSGGYSGASEDQLVNRFIRAPVLILDDIGYETLAARGPASAYQQQLALAGGADGDDPMGMTWAQRVWFRILDARYRARPTIVCTRNDATLAQALGQAGISRFLDNGGVFRLPEETPDYRQTRMRRRIRPEDLRAIEAPRDVVESEPARWRARPEES